MKSKQITLDKLIEEYQEISVPIYQRHYKWTPKECKRLIEDIQRLINNPEATHLFGTIIFEEYDGNKIHLIDGQQRIATTMLLLEALVQLVDENVLECHDKSLCKFIKDNYLYNKKQVKLKLKPFKDDLLAYESVFNKDTKNYEESNAVINFNFIKNYIEFIKVPADEIFYAIQRLEVIAISLSNVDDAQETFESFNSTGVIMSASDKIRNYILMGLTPDEQAHYFDDYWCLIEKNAGVDDVDAFIANYLIATHFYSISKCRKQKDIYEDFKTFARMKKNASFNMDDILSDMLDYSIAYRNIVNADTDNKRVNLCLTRMNRLKNKELIPFMMTVLHRYNNSEITLDDLTIVLENVEKACFRASIIPSCDSRTISFILNADITIMNYDNEGAKNYGQKFLYFINNHHNMRKLVDDTDFINGMKVYEPTGLRQLYMLERIDTYLNDGVYAKIYERYDKEDLHIEKIMPEILTREWHTELGSKAKHIADAWANNIINYTLLEGMHYGGKQPFSFKLSMRDGILFSELQINKWIKEQKKWTDVELSTRLDDFCKYAKKIWSLDNTDYEPYVLAEKVSIDDMDEFDCSEFDTYSFEDSGNITFSTWELFTVDIIKKLYRKNPQILKKIIKTGLLNSDFLISEDKNKYERIAEGVYVRRTHNSTIIVDNMRAILDEYDIDRNQLVFNYKVDPKKLAIVNKKQKVTGDTPHIGDKVIHRINGDGFVKLIENNMITIYFFRIQQDKKYELSKLIKCGDLSVCRA